MLDNGLGIYIHWPWCRSKCGYCDFNSYAAKEYNEERYVDYILKELNTVYFQLNKDLQKSKISSIYFGGGTPTLMSPNSTKKLIDGIKQSFDLHSNVEISMECNPATVDKKKLQDFKNAGINRLSIGVQSFDDGLLEFLGRKHCAKLAIETIKNAKEIFNNVSIDLIYGLPKQSLDSWKNDLKTAIDLKTNHISCYQLTIEPNTAFYRLYQNKELIMPDLDLQGEFFYTTRMYLESKKFNNYEVSNFAEFGSECKHNVNIWNYNSYIGLGAGAHSRIINKDEDVVARQNELKPKKYAELLESKKSVSQDEVLDNNAVAFEMVMLGLRLKDGLNINNLEKISKHKLEDIINLDNMNLLIEENMLTIEENYLKLTGNSYHLLNGIIEKLLV